MSIISTLNSKCTLCGNRCYISNLRCKRGINHYARLEAESIANEAIQPKTQKKEDITPELDTKETYDNSDDLSHLLMKTSHILHHRKGNKRGQGKLLKILAEKEEMNQKELQELLGIESGSMSELVIKLEQKELITRNKTEEDKRQVKIKITAQGLERIARMQERDKLDKVNLYDGLTSNEQETLRMLLNKLTTSWGEIEKKHPHKHR